MNYPDWYKNASAPFRTNGARRLLNALDKGLVALVATAYITALCGLAIAGDPRFWRALFVPAVTFALASALRAMLDMPRPYERFDIDPIIAKKTRGKSMPSRHVVSAAIIACALAWLNPLTGIAAFAACAAVSFARTVGGIHFPRDVIAAFAFALACGLAGFVLIP